MSMRAFSKQKPEQNKVNRNELSAAACCCFSVRLRRGFVGLIFNASAKQVRRPEGD